MTDTAPRPHVVILGGGFGGLAAARGLARAPVVVTLVDRTNHHLFQPLLYQVATAGLSPAEIASPIRRVLRRQRNAQMLLGEAVAIDTSEARRPRRRGDRLGLPDRRGRGGPLLLRPGRVGGARAGPEDAGRRARDPAAGARRLREGRGGGRSGGPAAVAHVRGRRGRAHGGRDGGRVRRDRAPHARPRLPPHRPAHRASPPRRSGPAHPPHLSRKAVGENAAAARGARRPGGWGPR
jgi:hypothetical protein